MQGSESPGVSAVGLGLSILVWGVVHSVLASGTAKRLARRLVGPLADRIYRLAYNLFSGLSLLPFAWLLFVLPDQGLYSIPLPWALMNFAGQGLALVALAVGLLQTGLMSFLGLRQLGEPFEEPPRLVTGGLYRFVRHPLYTAGLAFIWLMPSMTVNRLVLMTGATLYIVIGAHFEERKLRSEYGEAYAEYAAGTPMFVPFLKGKKAAS